MYLLSQFRFLIVLFTFLLVQTSFAGPNEFIVETVRGVVTVSPNGRPLKPKDRLKLNDIVTTAEKSFVKILNSDNGVISVGPKSSMQLMDNQENGASVINLLQGQVRAHFNNKNNKDYKAIVKSQTASMGVRGTDFHFIYNSENNISTVLTYEGNIDFVELKKDQEFSFKDFKNNNKINVPPGYISGVFSKEISATTPIKISPLQFSILENNREFKEGNGKSLIRPKESTSILKSETEKSTAKITTAPNKFTTDEYFEDRIKENPAMRNGGYLDLKSGIYVQPPESSNYDSKSDIYFPPVEFGGIDEISGEYVAPPGLILHPLKGFIFTTDVLQKGVSVVTTGVTDLGGMGLNMASKTVNAIKDNTGIVGSSVGTGAELVATGIEKTVDLGQEASSMVLGQVANSLNMVVHDVFLNRVSDVKNALPIIKYFKIKLTQNIETGHVNSDKYNMYDRYVERHNAVTSKTAFSFKAQKSFYTNFFARPRVDFKKTTMLSDNINLDVFNQYTLYSGVDLGYSSEVKNNKYQTFFSLQKGKLRKIPMRHDNYITHEDTWRFGFNKLLLSKQGYSTVFDYHYEKYKGPFDGKGHRHELNIAEVLSVSDTKFVRLLLNWNRILQERYANTTNWTTRMNFLMNTQKWDMSIEHWLGFRELYNTGTIIKRDKERNYFIGTSLSKNFKDNFSVQFGYEILKQTSPIENFKYTAQQFSGGVAYLF